MQWGNFLNFFLIAKPQPYCGMVFNQKLGSPTPQGALKLDSFLQIFRFPISVKFTLKKSSLADMLGKLTFEPYHLQGSAIPFWNWHNVMMNLLPTG